MAEPIRLSKLMSERGLCSRREADSYIERGWVFVDGTRVSELGTKVDPNCVIRLDNAASQQQTKRISNGFLIGLIIYRNKLTGFPTRNRCRIPGQSYKIYRNSPYREPTALIPSYRPALLNLFFISQL